MCDHPFWFLATAIEAVSFIPLDGVFANQVSGQELASAGLGLSVDK